jgi:hypothetical protein
MIGLVAVPRGRAVVALALLGIVAGVLGFAASARAHWHAPVAISGRGDIGQATLAVNAHGDAIAVWDRLIEGDVYSQETDAVVAAFRPAGKRWQRPIVVGTASELCGRGSCDFPVLSLAIGARGDAVVGWSDATDLASESVRIAARSASGVWGLPVAVYTYGGSLDPEARWPDEEDPLALVVDQHGNVTAVKTAVGASVKLGTQAAYKPAGRAWRKLVRIGTGFETRLTLDAKGGVLATWLNARPVVVQSAFRPLGGSWQRPVTIGRASAMFDGLQLAGDVRGDAVAAWIFGDSVHAAFRPAGAGWHKPVTLSRVAAWQLQTGLDQAGTATVSWRTSSGLQASFRRAGGTWGAPLAVPVYPSTRGETYRLATAPRGQTILVWTQFDAPVGMSCCTSSVWASIRSAQGLWQAPITMGTGASPNIAYGPHGSALVIWVQDQSVVQAQTFTQPG